MHTRILMAVTRYNYRSAQNPAWVNFILLSAESFLYLAEHKSAWDERCMEYVFKHPSFIDNIFKGHSGLNTRPILFKLQIYYMVMLYRGVVVQQKN